jgi:Rab GDP dissociation inhibitor
VSVVGNSHQVAAKGKFVAIVATTVETAKPADEVKAGLELLGKMITRFDNIVDTYAPVDDGRRSRVFVSSSYDASSHFESTTAEVLAMYKAIMGHDLDMSAMSTEVNTAE